MNLTFIKNMVTTFLPKKVKTSIKEAVNPITPVKKETKQTSAKPAISRSITVKTETPVKVEEPAKAAITDVKSGKYSNIFISLDPGHAKTTQGKKSPYSLGKQSVPTLPFEEWEFNRTIVNLLKEELAKYEIDSAITTDYARDKDTDLGLTKRAQRAYNDIKKSGKHGIFISIHADAQGYGDDWTSANGWSVYTTTGQTISDEFAEYLYDQAEKIFKPAGKKIRTNKSDGDRDCESNFTVIYKTEQFSIKNGKATIPAVLIENFFYTNIEDTRYITSKKGQEDIVKVIINAILKYAEDKKWTI